MADSGSQMMPSCIFINCKGCAHLFFIFIFLKFQYLCETQNHGGCLLAACFRHYFFILMQEEPWWKWIFYRMR